MSETLIELPWPVLAGFGAAFGACVGSFLNVVIHRVPRGESIVTPRSRCPACGAAIPAWANLPLISYALLRGRCRGCGGAISARYPLVEASTALLFVALMWIQPAGPRLLVEWGVGAALIAVAFIDHDHQIIPNSITLPGIPLGLGCALAFPPPVWLDALLGALLPGAMMWGIAAFYHWRTGRVGLGMGDVKLVAMLGAFLGIQPALGILVMGSLLGLAHASVSSGTMSRATTRCPAFSMRSAKVSPDLSVAGVRVSETVSRAMLTGRNARSPLIVAMLRHHDRFLAQGYF